MTHGEAEQVAKTELRSALTEIGNIAEAEGYTEIATLTAKFLEVMDGKAKVIRLSDQYKARTN